MGRNHICSIPQLALAVLDYFTACLKGILIIFQLDPVFFLLGLYHHRIIVHGLLIRTECRNYIDIVINYHLGRLFIHQRAVLHAIDSILDQFLHMIHAVYMRGYRLAPFMGGIHDRLKFFVI